MGIPNLAAKNEAADAFAFEFSAATLTIFDGSTVLAVHTLNGFSSANDGVVSASTIPDAINEADGEADSAVLKAGNLEYELTIGTDVIVSTTTYFQGETSRIRSLVVSF